MAYCCSSMKNRFGYFSGSWHLTINSHMKRAVHDAVMKRMGMCGLEMTCAYVEWVCTAWAYATWKPQRTRARDPGSA
jgi:hypothetical protein